MPVDGGMRVRNVICKNDDKMVGDLKVSSVDGVRMCCQIILRAELDTCY